MLTEKAENLTRKNELINTLQNSDGNNPTEEEILAAFELGIILAIQAFDEVLYETKQEKTA